MKAARAFAIYAVSLLILTPFAGQSQARADDADLAQVLKTLRALEARVASLESEKQQYRREAASARAETQALKQKLGKQANPNLNLNPNLNPPVQLPPSESYAMATKAPLPAAVPTWGGFYAGASFGLTSQGAHREEIEPFASTTISVGGTQTNTVSNSDIFTSSLSGRSPGAMANLFLGYNYMLPSNFLVGGQIEGSVSNMRTRLTGAFSDPSQMTQTVTDSGAIIFQNTRTGQDTGNATGHLDNRWAMAALVRGGFVVDPKDLAYLVGGLSYGRFEFANSDETFGAFGGTIGAGWERKITPSWTLKAEYRYTRFQDRTLSANFVSSSSATNTNGGTQTFTSASADINRISGLDWHTVMIGVSHYFDTY
jgi:opacity protein-like surface antigen